MTFLDDTLNSLADEVVAEYAAGGLEPDGMGLAFGYRPPGADLGYGTDLHCLDDCDENFSEVDPYSPEAVGEALYRRLCTPHGHILNDPEAVIAVGEDPDYGYNIVQLLSIDSSDISQRAHSDLAAAECMKDDRVRSATVEVVKRSAHEFDITLSGELKTGQVYKLVKTMNTAADVIDEGVS